MDIFRKTLQLQFQGFLATPPLWKGLGPISIPQYPTHQVPFSEKVEKDLFVPDNLILGKRIEFFFAFYVENFTSETLLARNVVINQGKTTIGEIDFLLLNNENTQYVHVELVYKFYLFDPESKGNLTPWIGPNRKDTLIKKLHRLKDHQFPLLHREESRKFTESLELPLEKIFEKVCFKANLFVPLKMLNKVFPEVNNDCIQGFWIRDNEFLEKDYGEYLFHSPKKSNWSIKPDYWEDWCNFKKIKEQLLPLIQARRSPLVWMKRSETEFLRFFVVWW